MFCHECGVQQVEGAKFCASCGTRLSTSAPPALNSAEPVSESPPPISGATPKSSEVKVLDAGDRLVLSGDAPEAVEATLQKYLGRGAKMVTPVTKVGRNWVAGCTIPPKTTSMEDTQSLRLQDVVDAVARTEADDVVDGCRVEEFGFKRIVYGPSLVAVQIRLKRMKHLGAEIVGEIEVQGEEWVAVVDMGGESNTGYRW